MTPPPMTTTEAWEGRADSDMALPFSVTVPSP